ncbi:DASH family cryptochrome [Flavobacterium sp. 7A]|uniref:DASH family cryptochrome n=1 Tax=Flavobacterium sp. 7A TaxID=2940571 RepID=UPI0022279289|nr:DASH family cryptochrome [Flavobacterium sp. 7A]MCW2120802.1 deoxyribodipyrimidine photo-lyase [Flavobacterium sp. 7A]
MMKSIVWFKTDLRIQDNETLLRAVEESEFVLPVYCFDDAHFETTDFGFKKTGSYRAAFLLEALVDLQKELQKRGANLVLLRGKPEIEIPKLVADYKITKVFAKREVAFEEKRTELLVQNELFKKKCEFETVSTSTLYHAEDLPFGIKDIPDVFTVFRKKAEKESTIRTIFEAPETINCPETPPFELPSLADLGLKAQKIDSRAALHFKGGEAQGLQRIQHYFYETKLISTYKETRNGMVGESYSSKFSAWLALGCLSPRMIYHHLKEYETQNGANESTYWLVFELLWRDYFRFVMKKYNHKLFLQGGIKEQEAQDLSIDQKKLKKWIDGKTGVDFVDANMIELKKTGFMSNRGRQNVASYLCNDLKLDWRYGAAYFEEQLIDYDVCSNWGNWAYLAGVGNDPRGNRYFNIEKQAKDYDKDRTFRDLWLT